MKGSVGPSEPGPGRLGLQTWGPCCYVFGDGRVGGGDGHDGQEDAASDIFWWCCRCRCQGKIMKPRLDHEIDIDWAGNFRLMVRSQLKSNRSTGTLPIEARRKAHEKLRMLVPTELFGSVMGHRGETLRNIIQSSRAQVGKTDSLKTSGGVFVVCCFSMFFFWQFLFGDAKRSWKINFSDDKSSMY